jgi:hypothetical protein
MAVIDKFEVRARISPEAKGATERISKLLDRSQSNLLERLILTWEALWLQQMTAAERTKYLAGELTFTDAVEIGTRWHPPSNGTGWLPPPPPNAQVVNPKASDAQCGTQNGAA